jgi:hypothetical protein
MNRGFASLHPAPCFLYYVSLVILVMIIYHPLFLLLALCSQILLNIMQDGGKKLKESIRFYIFFGLFIALINPFVSHRGQNVLFYFLDNPVTLGSCNLRHCHDDVPSDRANSFCFLQHGHNSGQIYVSFFFNTSQDCLYGHDGHALCAGPQKAQPRNCPCPKDQGHGYIYRDFHTAHQKRHADTGNTNYMVFGRSHYYIKVHEGERIQYYKKQELIFRL